MRVFSISPNIFPSLQVLEELGVMKNVRRFAGSSAGAMTAALLAVGYDSYSIEEFLSQDLSKIFLGEAWPVSRAFTHDSLNTYIRFL